MIVKRKEEDSSNATVNLTESSNEPETSFKFTFIIIIRVKATILYLRGDEQN